LLGEGFGICHFLYLGRWERCVFEMVIDASIHGDIELLMKYQTGRIIDPIDTPNLNRLASIGFVKKGVILRERKITAKTTAVGIKIITDLPQ
jgi:hypothetical protein